jgi:WD40 repeat protein
MASGRPIGTPLSGHFNWVNSLAFNVNDGSLVSGSRDGSVIVWSMDLAEWRAFACQITNRGLTEDELLQYTSDGIGEGICAQS